MLAALALLRHNQQMRRLWAIGAIATLTAAAEGLTPAERKASIDSFEKVWTTVRDKHWDPKLNGVDWQAVHDELRPKLEAADDKDAVRGILNDMVRRLKQSHFGVFSSDVYRDLDTKAGAKDSDDSPYEAQPGLDLRILDGHVYVTEVEKGSPAATHGVKPGWEIQLIGKTEIAPALARITKQFADSTQLDLRLQRAVLSRLEGRSGETVHVEFLAGDDHKTELDLERAKPRGKPVKLGSMPPMHVWSEWRIVRPEVGYVRFNMFMDPEALAATMAEAMKACGGCKGFIVDVRGNPGGLGGLAMGVAGWLVDQKGLQLGTMFMRNVSPLKFVVFPRAEPFRGPVAILVDGCSASTSEIFAGGMKDIGRARIFGTRTAGAALPSVIERLPNGDGFQYAVANYISQGGKPLEGIGVIPDEEIRPTRKQLLDGNDPAMDAALRWIEKRGPGKG